MRVLARKNTQEFQDRFLNLGSTSSFVDYTRTEIHGGKHPSFKEKYQHKMVIPVSWLSCRAGLIKCQGFKLPAAYLIRMLLNPNQNKNGNMLTHHWLEMMGGAAIPNNDHGILVCLQGLKASVNIK